MSYTEKEAKILIDFHRQYGQSSLENGDDPLDDLPDNLDDYCDDCGHAPERCKCNRHLEILEERIELYESWQRPSVPIKFAKMQATFFWEGYCDGAGLDWDTREAGRRRVQEIDD